jgi:hypothetical protein
MARKRKGGRHQKKGRDLASFEEIGKALGVTTERAHQLYNSGMAKLRRRPVTIARLRSIAKPKGLARFNWNFTGLSMSGGTETGTSSPITSNATLYAQVIGCPSCSNSGIGSATYTISGGPPLPPVTPTAPRLNPAVLVQ